jgi:hypothetical protein
VLLLHNTSILTQSIIIIIIIIMMVPSSPPDFDDMYRIDTTNANTGGTTADEAAVSASSAAGVSGNSGTGKRNNRLVGRMRGLRNFARVKDALAKAKDIGKDKVRLPKMGQVLQKMNLPRLIDEMEHDQELADDLECINQQVLQQAKEQQDRTAMVLAATAACQREIEQHLDEFLLQKLHTTSSHHQASDHTNHSHPPPPSSSLPRYEEWIQDLHPENVATGHIFDDLHEVDIRFYVQDSDHRLLWNARMAAIHHPEQQVAARSYQHLLVSSSSTTRNNDLLDDDENS